MTLLFLLAVNTLSIQVEALSGIAARCASLMEQWADSHESFAVALKAESDQQVKKYALIIKDDIKRHGEMTEVGAYGKDLSWKWLGVIAEGEGPGKKHKVVGYGNFQHFMSPYAEMARAGQVSQIAVGSNFRDEVFIDGQEFEKLPLRTRQKLVRAIHLSLNPKRVRVYQPNEKDELWRTGTLPQVGGSLSLVGQNDPGASLSILSMTRGNRSAAEPGKLDFMIDPTQPIIIGRQAVKVRHY